MVVIVVALFAFVVVVVDVVVVIFVAGLDVGVVFGVGASDDVNVEDHGVGVLVVGGDVQPTCGRLEWTVSSLAKKIYHLPNGMT